MYINIIGTIYGMPFSSFKINRREFDGIRVII